MPRSRNIKPGFFKNELLAEISHTSRLYFIGLWTLADCNGRVEFRPKKIKAELFPYEDIDPEIPVLALEKYGFVRVYTVAGSDYIEIVNFLKHQNPHKKERDAGSEIPEPTEKDYINYADRKRPGISGSGSGNSGTSPADSLNLIPDSRFPSIRPELKKSFIELILNTKEPYPIFEEDIAEWENLYQSVDVRQELRNMCGWLNANPEKRKTKRGIKRFINGWLSKTQDKGNTNGPHKQISAAQRVDAAIYGCLEEYDSEAGNVFNHD